jgi:hypothetical protein
LTDTIGVRADSGEESVLTLTVSAPGVDLSKDATVTFGRAVDPMHFDQPELDLIVKLDEAPRRTPLRHRNIGIPQEPSHGFREFFSVT